MTTNEHPADEPVEQPAEGAQAPEAPADPAATDVDAQQDDEPAGDGELEQDEAPADEPAEPEGEQAKAGGNREAAKYRTRLREVEKQLDAERGELDTVRGQLRAARIAVLAQHPAARRIAESARADAFAEPDGLFDEVGNVDESALSAFVSDLATSRPYMLNQILPDPAQEAGTALDSDMYPGEPGAWETAFTPPFQR